MERNVVLVSIDSLRADRCGFMGYDRDTTPTLDEIAHDGVVFENTIAPGNATPVSMPAIFTGSDPLTGTPSHIRARDSIRRHMAVHETIPETFSNRGYATAGISPNPFTSRVYGFDEGFDYFEDFLDGTSLAEKLRNKVVSRWLDGEFVAGLRFGLNMVGIGDSSVPWDSYYRSVLDHVSSIREPFFLWVFLLEPHWPYRPPPGYRNGRSLTELYRVNWRTSPLSDHTPDESDGNALRDLYDGTIRYADEFLQTLREDLVECDPVWVVHADHGEAFGEHGVYGHGPYLYEENIHVPLVVGNVDDSARVERPVSLRTLPDIVRSIASAPPPDWRSFTSDWVCARTQDTDYATRGRDWKVYVDGNGVSWYDLDTDPDELDSRSVDSETTRGLPLVMGFGEYRFTERDRIIRTARALGNDEAL